jgi:hypothetical protein
MNYTISDSRAVYRTLRALRLAVTRREQSETLGEARAHRLQIVKPERSNHGFLLVNEAGDLLCNSEGRFHSYSSATSAKRARAYLGGQIKGGRLAPLTQIESKLVDQ